MSYRLGVDVGGLESLRQLEHEVDPPFVLWRTQYGSEV